MKIASSFLAAFLILAPRGAAAGDCDEERPLPDEAAYYDWCRSCGGTPSGTLGTLRCDFGSGGSGNTGGPRVSGEKVVLAAVLIIAFPLIPGVMIEWAAGENAFGNPAEAKARWRTHRLEVEADEELGRRVARMRAAVGIEPDEELRDAAASKRKPKPKRKLKPFNPPGLQPSLERACERARIEFPYHDGGPIGGLFPNENTMIAQCTQAGHIQAPVPSQVSTNGACQAGELLCPGSGRCCPQTHPVFNPCDQICYRSADFRGANAAPARRCANNEQCGAFQP